ncbi:MAG: tetraacyldisaccharide 4'-kinase [Bacteroidales bacterium]
MFRFLLYPFSLVYGFVVKFRNILFDLNILKSVQFNIPVILVGNITVGGTGKTPHVEYLVKLLKDHYKTGVLSRGYKRKTKGIVHASTISNSDEIGDEPTQIKNKFPDIDVVVNAGRVEGIKYMISAKTELVILDDAYQHRYVKPGLSILLIDYNRQIDKSHLLPYGDLRESKDNTKRADIIIITKTPELITPAEKRVVAEGVRLYPYQKLFFTSLRYGNLCAVFPGKEDLLLDFMKNHELFSILVVTGIAYSQPFIKYLEKYSENIVHLKFGDHSSYTASRLNKIKKEFMMIKNDKRIIITTEKDAVKLREVKNMPKIIADSLFYIPIEVFFLENEQDFINKIISYVKKN